MPFSGTLTKKAHFIGRSTVAGSLSLTPGTAVKIRRVFKSVAGVLSFASTTAKVAHFKRSAAGILTMAGTLTKKARFKRLVVGSAGRFSGIVTKAVVKTVTGALHLASTLTRKVMFKRTVEGSLHTIGAGSKTFARFKRTVAGSIHFSSTLTLISGLGKAAYGYLTMTAALTWKVMFKRGVSGQMHMNADLAKSTPFRRRTIKSNLYFIGRAAIATGVTQLKRGLNKLGFNIRID
jgi:hypothetical protein